MRFIILLGWYGCGHPISGPGMQQVCSKKSPGPLNKKRALLQQEVVGAPMERVVLDILRPLRETREVISTSMVVRDYLSKCMEAYPIPDQTTETAAEKLVSEFDCRFGPKGTAFRSTLNHKCSRKCVAFLASTRQEPPHTIQSRTG